MPAIRFKYLVLNDAKHAELINPKTDIRKEVIPIINAEDKRGVEVNLSEIPAPNASILVKIPNKINHFKLHLYLLALSSPPKASSITFIPKNKNMPKTIGLESGAIYLYTKFVK